MAGGWTNGDPAARTIVQRLASGNWYERSISQGWSFIVEKWKMAADVVASSSSVSMIQEMLARCLLEDRCITAPVVHLTAALIHWVGFK